MKLHIQRATASDAATVAEIYNKAFYADFLEFGECPGYGRTPQDMAQTIAKYEVYRADVDGEPAGAVSVHPLENGDYYLAALCVIPEKQNLGLGQAILQTVFAQYPQDAAWSLITPMAHQRNLYFYGKLGFRVVGQQQDGKVLLAKMEKRS